MCGPLPRFLNDRCGATGAEFALIVMVFSMLLIGIIDFNRALYEYNRIEKSCRVGARFAVVHDMVAPDMFNWDGVTDGGLVAGQTIPTGAITPVAANCTCSNVSGDPPVCGSVTCDAYAENEPPDQGAFDAILQEMEAIYSGLNSPDTVISIKYEHIGLGIAGNPVGPDVWPLTTVAVQGPSMDLATPIVGAAAGPIQFNCSASLTGEDFEN